MLFLRKIFLFLFLILNISLAADIVVQRDTSAANYGRGADSSFVWTGTAEFSNDVSDGQLVQIAEDAYKSLLLNAEADQVPIYRLPLVMTALMHKRDNSDKYDLYLASSAKGDASLIYKVKFATEDQDTCGNVWSEVPKPLKAALKECSAMLKEGDDNATPSDSSSSDDETEPVNQHGNGASCGEMNVLMMIAAKFGELPDEIKQNSKIVTWEGRIKKYKYKEGKGKIKAPCSKDGTFGCKDVLASLSEGIRIVEEGTALESYADNKPDSVGFQPMFPNYVTPGH